MKTIKAWMLAVLLTLALTSPSNSDPFQITFGLGPGVTGSGQIDIQQNSSGDFFAAGGYLDISGGTAAGNWTLFTANGSATYPGHFTSPAGAYWYNNAFYPDGANPQYPNVDVPLDNYGLLFRDSSGDELNLWGNADGSFTLHGSINGWQNFSATIFSSGGPGTPVISFTPVPEPHAIVLFAFAGLCLVVHSARRLTVTPTLQN